MGRVIIATGEDIVHRNLEESRRKPNHHKESHSDQRLE